MVTNGSCIFSDFGSGRDLFGSFGSVSCANIATEGRKGCIST